MKGRFMKETLASEFEKLFGEPAQIFAQAPGRIEFIGNHTDYNGGYVMGVAIDKTIMCALSRRDDRKLCFGSIKKGEKVFVDLDRIVHQPRSHNWVNYPLGVVKFLIEAGMKPDCGFNMLDISSLPAGAGLSSSAAIELCTAMGVSKLTGSWAERRISRTLSAGIFSFSAISSALPPVRTKYRSDISP